MANKETQDLLLEALDFYIQYLAPDNARPSIENMRKIVKLDDIKRSLSKNE